MTRLNMEHRFLYGGMHVEDEEIALKKSVQMWTAEGLVRSKQATLGNPVKGHFHSMQLFNIYIFF